MVERYEEFTQRLNKHEYAEVALYHSSVERTRHLRNQKAPIDREIEELEPKLRNKELTILQARDSARAYESILKATEVFQEPLGPAVKQHPLAFANFREDVKIAEKVRARSESTATGDDVLRRLRLFEEGQKSTATGSEGSKRPDHSAIMVDDEVEGKREEKKAYLKPTTRKAPDAVKKAEEARRKAEEAQRKEAEKKAKEEEEKKRGQKRMFGYDESRKEIPRRRPAEETEKDSAEKDKRRPSLPQGG